MKKISLIILIFTISINIIACSPASSDKQKSIKSIDLLNIQNKANGVEINRLEYDSDGLNVVGFILKPEEVAADTKLPVLIFNRGGNQNDGMITTETLGYLSNWASQGYVVLASQYRGNGGSEGKEEFGGSDVNDVLNLMNVAKELDYADEDHTVMLGLSRGGLMSYLGMKNNMNVKAVAVIGGISDLSNFYHSRKDVRPMLEDLVGNPVDNSDAYAERSAVNWVNELDLPLLILHGEKDQRVPVTQVRELAKELKEENKTYKYIEYPGGDHTLSTHFEEAHEEIFKWFDQHLK
ncbi:alpha/beta hydrolase family protein [Sutcliffiella horikoshii]|uniref:alpha/beta hydrolase family protein n=1 Tax=Sutcliffiella horikoshii TaxID=79883 RepID=UPI003CF9DFB4